METTTFETAKELKENITKKQYKIVKIDYLLSLSDLSCEIKTPKKRSSNYISYNTEFLKKLLEDDKTKLQIGLDKLTEKFNRLK